MTAKQHIPQGYKKTEVGVIPEEWEVKAYGEIFSFLKTASLSRSELSQSGDIGYVHYGDIHTKWHSRNKLDLSKNTLPTISKRKAKAFPLIEDGDLIISDASEDYEGVGESVEVNNPHEKKAISGLHTILLRDKEKTIAKNYKAYLHKNKSVKKQYIRLSTGLKVYGISKSKIKEIKLPLPPKPEQAAIARALSDMDALIEAQEKLIAKKLLIKQGAMQELLKPKKHWVKKRLGEVASITKGEMITKKNVKHGNIPVIGGGTKPSYYHNIANKKPNTITISASGASAGYVAYHPYSIFASDCSTIEENENYNILFIFYPLHSIQSEIIYLQTGGAQPHVYPHQLRKLAVSYPDCKTEQDIIANILGHMDNEIKNQEKKLVKYCKIKEGMMQELLTGKTRLL